jgi:hypothetical protein
MLRIVDADERVKDFASSSGISSFTSHLHLISYVPTRVTEAQKQVGEKYPSRPSAHENSIKALKTEED